MTTILLKKLLVPQPVKKYSAFYRTWRLITVCITARHSFISWVRLIQRTLPNHISLRSNSIRHSHLGRHPSKRLPSQPARQPRTTTVSQCRNCWHSCASEAAVYRMYATCAAATPAPPLFVLKRITLCFTSLSTLPVKFFKPLSLPKFHKRHQVQICLKNCLAWHGLALCFIAHTVSLARGDVMSVRLSVYLSV